MPKGTCQAELMPNSEKLQIALAASGRHAGSWQCFHQEACSFWSRITRVMKISFQKSSYN